MLYIKLVWHIQREESVTPRSCTRVEDALLGFEDSVAHERNTRFGLVRRMASFMQEFIRSTFKRMIVEKHLRDLELGHARRLVAHRQLVNQSKKRWVKSKSNAGIAQLNTSFA